MADKKASKVAAKVEPPGGEMTTTERKQWPALRIAQIVLGIIATAILVMAVISARPMDFALMGGVLVAFVIVFALANYISKRPGTFKGQMHTLVWGIVILFLVGAAFALAITVKRNLFTGANSSEATPRTTAAPFADSSSSQPPTAPAPAPADRPSDPVAQAPQGNAPTATPRRDKAPPRPKRESAVREAAPALPTTIVQSFGQTGGITAGAVNMGPRPPTFEALGLSQPKQIGNAFEWSWRFKLVADGPIPSLLVIARAPTATGIKIEHVSGMTVAFMAGWAFLKDKSGVFHTQRQVNPGTYIAKVTTTAQSPAPAFELAFPPLE